MQVNQRNDFVTYELTEDEFVAGSTLNYLQVGVIQNRRMEITEQLVQLKPHRLNDEGKESYWQEEAYLRGQLDILTHLITASKAAELAVNPDQSLSNPIQS